MSQNQPEKAVSDFTKSIAINSKAVPVWQNRGNSHISLAHWKDVLADLCKSVELEPDNGVALNNLAWLLANCPEREFRDAGRAVGLAKRAVELSPEAGYLQNTLGVALFRDGQERAAIEALQKSIDLRKGGDAFDYWFLAMSHWRLGNKDEGARLVRPRRGLGSAAPSHSRPGQAGRRGPQTFLRRGGQDFSSWAA